MKTEKRYDTVIGLEVHIQLKDVGKLFAPEAYEFGTAPNSTTSVVSLAHPGTLPIFNRSVLRPSFYLAEALQAKCARRMIFDRKHYFYPDLPKGYQTTQDSTPIILGGHLAIKVGGKEKLVAIHHAHLEEDAGKSIHDELPQKSLVDINRSGTPLIELVTEPCLYSPDEAVAFFEAMRDLVRALGICDGNMQEGNLRCDANISLKPAGSKILGTRAEIKNINSFKFLRKAINFEIKRQTALLDAHEPVVQETRGYNAERDITESQRDKENAHDYRYFPEPDVPPILISEVEIENWRKTMPKLPTEILAELKSKGLSDYDANQLKDEPAMRQYFFALVASGAVPKEAVNWIIGALSSLQNEAKWSFDNPILSASKLAELLQMVRDKTVHSGAAQKEILPQLLANPSASAQNLAKEGGWTTQLDENEIVNLAKEIVKASPAQVAKFQKGNKGVLGFFMGQLMQKTGGKIDPSEANKILTELLEK